MARQQLAILGSGWGAARLLKDICPKKYAVTVISPRNHMLFTPLMPSASIGTVDTRSICEPLRPSIAAKGARYCEALAEHVDLQDRVVRCKSLHGDKYDVAFDRLIVAVGKQANDFGNPNIRKYAHFMKETADADRLRESFLRRLEEAAFLHGHPQGSSLSLEEVTKIEQLLSMVVVGGGPTSVMFASELTDFIARDVTKMYPQLKEHIAVHLVEWASCTVNTHRPDKALRSYARSRLAKKSGVRIHQSEIDQVTQSSLLLKNGNVLPYGTLLWNAGHKAVPLVESLDLPKAPCSRLILDPFLRCAGHSHVYALGDCGRVGEDGLPQTAQVAEQQAAYLAQQLNGEEASARPFALKGLPSMTYGCAAGSKSLLPDQPWAQHFNGWLAWMAYRSSFFSTQLSVRNRVAIASDKVSAALFGCSMTRLGEDSGDLPSSMASPSRAPARQMDTKAAKLQMDDKLLSSILDDIGMRQVTDLMQMPRPQVAHSGNLPNEPPKMQVRK